MDKWFDRGYEAAVLYYEDNVLTFCRAKVASQDYYQFLNGWQTYEILTRRL